MPSRIPPPLATAPWPAREPLGEGGATLARPRQADARAVLAMASDPVLWVDVPMAGRVTTLARARQDVTAAREHWEAHGFGYWHVWDGAGPDTPDEGALLGVGGLRWLWWHDGWVLNVYVRFAAVAHGRGLATGMLGLAFDRVDQGLAGPTTVVVRTRPGNDRMARLAHRLGFVEAGTEERELGTYRVLVRHVGGTRQ